MQEPCIPFNSIVLTLNCRYCLFEHISFFIMIENKKGSISKLIYKISLFYSKNRGIHMHYLYIADVDEGFPRSSH